MSDQDIFNNDDNKPPVDTPPVSPDNPFSDKLTEIKNENGEQKYKTVESALDALQASQQFIEKLKSENQTISQTLQEREVELSKLGSIDDFVNRIAPNANPNDGTPTSVPKEGLSEEKVQELMNQAIQQRDQQSVAQDNLKSVVSKLSEVHGDKAAVHIKQRAIDLNTTPAALQELAMSNPAMALSLLSGDDVKPNSSPSQSTNTPPMSPPNDNEPPKFEKGVARGGVSNKEVMEMWKRSADYTNKRIGLEN